MLGSSRVGKRKERGDGHASVASEGGKTPLNGVSRSIDFISPLLFPFFSEGVVGDASWTTHQQSTNGREMCTETNWKLAGYDGPSSIKIKLAQFLQFDSVENFNNKRLGGSGGGGHLDIGGPAGF